jgi:hypothetical protein
MACISYVPHGQPAARMPPRVFAFSFRFGRQLSMPPGQPAKFAGGRQAPNWR